MSSTPVLTEESDSKESNPSPGGSSSSSLNSGTRKPAYRTESNQVRYTGDWSADSKLSAISNGYWEDPFFKLFNVADATKLRRTSLICRGYYVRFRVCDFFLRHILRVVNQPLQIVSLGCGMDTTYFRILPELESLIHQFYEVDFKSVITTKKSLILHNEILQLMASNKLKLLHCDLRHVDTLEEVLKNGGFDFDRPTLFYSECVVNYLRPHENVKILQWITENVPNSIWLAYEQCNANDSFGQVMVSHFLKNGCPLLSLLSAQSREDQEVLLKQSGFRKVQVMNAWDAFLQIGEREPPFFPMLHGSEQQFDEYEQLLATCLHYSVRIGINGALAKCSPLLDFLQSFKVKDEHHHGRSGHKKSSANILPSSFSCHVKSYPVSSLPRLTAHRSVATIDGTIFTFGGSGENSRRMKHLISSSLIPSSDEDNESVGPPRDPRYVDNNLRWQHSTGEYTVETKILSENPKLYERIHSCAVFVPPGQQEESTVTHSNSVLIFGGRKSPKNPCSNDLIEVNLNDPLNVGDKGNIIISPVYGKCPPPRWRHCMVYCHKNGIPSLLLFGGRNTEAVLGDCWWYTIEDYCWTEREMEPNANQEPSARHSHVMVSDDQLNHVYMLGGMSMNDASLCMDGFWFYDCTLDKWTNIPEFNSPARRIGHSAAKHNNKIVIVGGYGADSSYPLDTFAIVLDLESSIVHSITNGLPREELFLPFGFSACPIRSDDDSLKLLVFGGGGNCFSFGTHFNQVCFEVFVQDDAKDVSSSV